MINGSRKKFMMGGVALALAGVLTVGTIATHMNNVEVEAAKNTLDGIERIISENSSSKPFTILEIVPQSTARIPEVKTDTGSLTLKTGTIGYLISGNEPVNIDDTLSRLTSSDDRKKFMQKMQTALSPVADEVSNNKPLTMVSYNEYLSDFLTEDQKASGEFKKFTPSGIVSMNGLSMNAVSANGAYTKKYVKENEDGTVNTDAEDFFNKNDQTTFVSANNGDFDPEFALASGTLNPDSGYYSVIFKANNGTRASYRLVTATDSKIKPGLSNNKVSGNELELPVNTCLYTENGDGTYSFAGYLAEVDGKVSVNSVPSYTPYVFTTGSVTTLHTMKYRAAANVSGDKAEESISADSGRSGVEIPEVPAGSAEREGVSDNGSGEPENLTPSGNSASGNIVSGNSVSDNIEGEEQEQSEIAAGDVVTYYILDFECVKDGSGTYNIQSFERIAEDPNKMGNPYKLVDTNSLVTNYEHKGSVKNINDSNDCIVYEKTGNGNYNIYQDAANKDVWYFENIEIYYKGGFKNNEWFKQYVFDRNTQSEYDRLNIVVYTVSAASVATGDVEKADLIYLSAGTSEFLPKYDSLDYKNYSAGTYDLSPAASKTLLYQAAMRNKPVIADYQLLKNEALKGTYAWKTAKVLSAKDVKSAYNKYANGYVTDGIETRSDEDKTWVNKNIYIFNDFLHPNDGHTVLNENFQKVNGDNKSYINDGLTEVIDDIKKTNESRAAEKKVAETVHEATIIRYILNISKQGVLSTKESIRILEIEPSELDYSDYKYDAVDGRALVSQGGGINGFASVKSDGTYDYKNSYDLYLNLKYDLSVKVSENGTNVLQYTKWDEENPEPHTILSTTGKIDISKMSMAEFIGKVEDLNSEYDMIFIGDDTSAMTHSTVKRTNNNGNLTGWYVPLNNNTGTEYNDSDMNGLIYSNVGDYTYISRKLIGSVPNDYKNKVITYKAGDIADMSDYKGETKNGGTYDHDSTVGRTRFSGNDMKQADIDKILDFAKADYPVVFGDLLINDDNGTRSVNSETVDNCSHIYQLIKRLLNDEGTKDNVFRISDITDREVLGAAEKARTEAKKKLFVQSVEALKPEIKLISPTLDGNDKAPVTVSDTGNYVIDLKFRIDDTGSGQSSAYAAHFYTDLNADGKYAVNEELKGSVIRFVDSAGNNVAQTALSAGNEYRAICKLDSTYVAGVYPWKLSVTQTGNEHRRDCIIGYATVTLNEKKTIRVLQITSDSYQKINLKNYMNEYKKANGRKTALGYYLSNIPGFEIDLTEMGSKDFIYNKVKPAAGETLSAQTYLDELRKYDLVIIGFADTYRWGNSSDVNKENLAAEGLLGYIAEGNSVLFSHDATSYYNVDSKGGNYDDSLDGNGASSTWYWGFSFNQYLRNIVGMNRYGTPTKADSSSNPTIQALLSGQKFDEIYQPRSNTSGNEGGGIKLRNSQAHALVTFSLIRGQINRSHWGDWRDDWMEPEDIDKDKKPDNTSMSSWLLHYNNHYPSRISNGNYTQGDNNKTTGVERVNRGQITEYPYVLPEKFDVTNTHGQYYQLNLDLDDDKDGESDVVVWYTMGSVNPVTNKNLYHMYNMTGRDVRNNYYIYNRGNLTYSGQGHTSFTNDNDTYTGSNPGSAVDATECKLLVNTIIAAYSAGTRECKVTFHETGSSNSKKMKSDIIPYDTLYNMNSGNNENYFPGASRRVEGDTSTDPVMTAYIEISDTNIVYSKKIYAKFSRKQNASLATGGDNALLPLEILSITPLTDDGEVAAGYRDVYSSYNADTGEFLLYDTTNAQDLSAVNAGKMFKVVYSLKDFNVNPEGLNTGITNVPGIAVTTRTEIQRKEGGIVTQKTSEDDLILIRTQLFNLK
ncbi:MAG: DUF5057 domain-containing protein [Lachnospiraceae bacterium]|nr:DUF5057 domain-containing protein [Lachnospiraceae bacterium]